MKRVFQVIAKKDGARSQPFLLTDAQLCKVLQDDGMDNDDYYILVIGDEGAESYSDVPLITARHYVAMFGQIALSTDIFADIPNDIREETHWLDRVSEDPTNLGDR